MHNNLNKKQVVYFSRNITIEEEYTIFTAPEPRKELPSQPINGKHTLLKYSEYLEPVNMNTNSYDTKKPELFNVLTGLFLCEPFFNLIKIFKERAEYCYDLKFFLLINEVLELVQSVQSTYIPSINSALFKIDKIINQTDSHKIYEAILKNLHDDFNKYYYFQKRGWVVQGDKNINTIENKYVGFSPVTELFVTEIKKQADKKPCRAYQHDLLEIRSSIENELENLVNRSDIKRPIKKYPNILALKLNATMVVKEEIKFGTNTYFLRSIIAKDGRIVTKSGHGEYVMAFYRISKMND